MSRVVWAINGASFSNAELREYAVSRLGAYNTPNSDGRVRQVQSLQLLELL